MTTNILPFGTSTDSPTNDLQQIKLFGCTVVDFNVSADWSSQGGGLTCTLIEDEYYRDPYTNQLKPDRLIIPVLGTPTLFELKKSDGTTVFQYIGLVESFTRNASSTKTYSATLTSPLKILDSSQVILDGYTGLGSSIEGSYDMAGLKLMDFGHNNSLINVTDRRPGVYHWWNVANLINAYGILENDDISYRVGTEWDSQGYATKFGGYGFSGNTADGMPLLKLMWAIHNGINHIPAMYQDQRTGIKYLQRSHGGNLLYGRGNYDITAAGGDQEAYPYYYHFDALDFYNKVKNRLPADFRIAGQSKTIREIIAQICDEINVEFYCYIDIYKTRDIGNAQPIGNLTLQEDDPNWGFPARMNWLAGNASKVLDTRKFCDGGRYGGTIRVNIIDKSTFSSAVNPFGSIAYGIIGLEVPDIKDHLWKTNDSGIHPGKRPVFNTNHGIAGGTYSDPLDSSGIPEFNATNIHKGFTDVGTKSVAEGGIFPVQSGDLLGSYGSGIFDPNKLSLTKLKNSQISIKHNDVTTMKVVTGGYQSRMVHVPGRMLRQYWGDIILPGGDPRLSADTATDPLGLNETSSRKVPVVTPILDPRDIDDFILIDMKTIFGNFTCYGVLYNGIYAASMLEIRCAMKSEASWKAFFNKYKFTKLRNLMACLYPQCLKPGAWGGYNKNQLEKSTESINDCNGLGYVGASEYFGLGNTLSLAGGDGSSDTSVDSFNTNNNGIGSSKAPADVSNTPFGLGINLPCAAALANLKKDILPAIFEKVKEIGDTHYGKSWYAPVPYHQSIQDLDGNNLVGSFKRSWEIADSAYTEPSLYYEREIPQANNFINDGKVSPFINYNNNFLITDTAYYDKSYLQDMTNLLGQQRQIFNFSEYNMDELCTTKYGSLDIIHAAPQNVSQTYSFMPVGYDYFYNRALLPFSDLTTGQSKRWKNTKTVSNQFTYNNVNYRGLAPTGEGSAFTDNYVVDPSGSLYNYNTEANFSSQTPAACPGAEAGQIADGDGYFETTLHGVPSLTNNNWLVNTVYNLTSLDYNDNGRFCHPFVKFTSGRVFLPVPSPNSPVNRFPSTWGFNLFVGAQLSRSQGYTCGQGSVAPGGAYKQFLLTGDQIASVLNPFPACAAPRSFSYPQRSTRYVYGPWMTSYNQVLYRGKVEYEQDESLVPENFLVPTNFGRFGEFLFNQTSGFVGMNLAAQGRANSIDNFGLFALEEGSFTIPGAPQITRIGDALYGIPQITDISIRVSNDTIETTYSFKTIAPKFGKNTRDLERKMTKISNDIKKLKLR